MNEYWVTFFCHYDALSFRDKCRKDGVPCRLSSVPRQLSSSCGTAATVIADGEFRFNGRSESVFLKRNGEYQQIKTVTEEI